MIEIVILIYIIGIGILFYEQSLHGDVDIIDILMWPVIAMMIVSIACAVLMWQVFYHVKRKYKLWRQRK